MNKIPSSLVLHIQKTDPSAIIPTRKSEGAAGFDIHLSHDTVIPPNGLVKARTGLSFGQQDPNQYIRISPRSSTIFKWGILVIEGIIDADYRGEVLIVLKNLNLFKFCEIPKGTSIAQIVIHQITLPEIVEVSQHSNTTARGDKGFGSTDTYPKTQ